MEWNAPIVGSYRLFHMNLPELMRPALRGAQAPSPTSLLQRKRGVWKKA